MLTNREIVEALAKERRVEGMLEKIAGRPITGDLCDLVQEVYMVILCYNSAKLSDLWEHGQINFFIARILLNQYNSANSPFHYTYRVPLLRSRPVNENDAKDEGRI